MISGNFLQDNSEMEPKQKLHTVWIVEEGSYEESEIVGVYATEELARFNHPQLNEKHNWRNPHWIRVEEFVVKEN